MKKSQYSRSKDRDRAAFAKEVGDQIANKTVSNFFLTQFLGSVLTFIVVIVIIALVVIFAK